MDLIRIADPEGNFTKAFADCAILTQDGKIILQTRSWGKFAGCLSAFGGHIEKDEMPLQAVIRELNEELGAIVLESDIVHIGAVTEEMTGHNDVVHMYFWHDRHGTITGCYEGEAVYYDDVDAALAHPEIMDYLVWLLKACRDKGLIR